ncbi:MAG: FAD-dependent oxidoreductase [bacterium]
MNKKNVLVLGGGIAGISTSLELDNLGYKVFLLEKETRLGGKVTDFCCKATDKCALCGVCLATEKLHEIQKNSKITIHTGASLIDLKGSAMTFKSKIEVKGKIKELDISAVVIATGYKPFDARQKGHLGYKRYENIISGLDLEEMLRNKPDFLASDDFQNIAFIQCVGSRDPHIGHNYCSKVCCKYGIRLANRIKYRYPQKEITIYYMDIQKDGKGFYDQYEKALQQIKFINGIPVRVKINSENNKKINIICEDISNNMMVQKNYDLVVLSIGMDNPVTDKGLDKFIGIERDDAGFFRTRQEGIFLAGACQGPKNIVESIAHGREAALRVAEALR